MRPSAKFVAGLSPHTYSYCASFSIEETGVPLIDLIYTPIPLSPSSGLNRHAIAVESLNQIHGKAFFFNIIHWFCKQIVRGKPFSVDILAHDLIFDVYNFEHESRNGKPRLI